MNKNDRKGKIMARILILEDDEDIAFMNRHVQNLSGYESVIVPTIADAIRALEAFTPDIALIDLHLPDGCGVEFAHLLRNRFPEIGCIAISGNFDPWDDKTLLAGDFHACIHKPVTIHDLRTKIVDVIRHCHCPCNRNLCLPKELRHLRADTVIDKTCVMCGAHWQTVGDLHGDPTVYPIGLFYFAKRQMHVLQFNHHAKNCGTTLALEFPASEESLCASGTM